MGGGGNNDLTSSVHFCSLFTKIFLYSRVFLDPWHLACTMYLSEVCAKLKIFLKTDSELKISALVQLMSICHASLDNEVVALPSGRLIYENKKLVEWDIFSIYHSACLPHLSMIKWNYFSIETHFYSFVSNPRWYSGPFPSHNFSRFHPAVHVTNNPPVCNESL